MTETWAAVTKQGRVTLPVEIRRALGLNEGDRVAFVLEGDEVRIRRAGSVAEWTAGMLKGDESPETAERLREIAEQAIAGQLPRRETC